MKNLLLILVAGFAAFFLWKKHVTPGTSSALASGSALAPTPVQASRFQGSGNLAPEAPFYSSVPGVYANNHDASTRNFQKFVPIYMKRSVAPTLLRNRIGLS